MTREEFIQVLDREGYSYEIEGDKIVVNTGRIDDNNGNVWLSSISSIPPNVEFNNKGDVDLRSVKVMPSGVVFNNGGRVIMISLIFGGYGWFSKWEGNIDGVDSNRLLNFMIKQGVFI